MQGGREKGNALIRSYRKAARRTQRSSSHEQLQQSELSMDKLHEQRKWLVTSIAGLQCRLKHAKRKERAERVAQKQNAASKERDYYEAKLTAALAQEQIFTAQGNHWHEIFIECTKARLSLIDNRVKIESK